GARRGAARRYTFSLRGPGGAVRHHVQGLVVFGAALTLTSGALAVLHAVSTAPGRLAEVAVLVLANLAATALRFVLLRTWVFGPRQAPAPAAAPIPPTASAPAMTPASATAPVPPRTRAP